MVDNFEAYGKENISPRRYTDLQCSLASTLIQPNYHHSLSQFMSEQSGSAISRERSATSPEKLQTSFILPITYTKINRSILPGVYVPDILGLKQPPEGRHHYTLTNDDLECSGTSHNFGSIMKPGGYWASVFNLLNATLGAGSVTVPYAASKCGLVPFLLINTILVTCSTTTVQYLCEAVQMSGSRSFETLSFTTGGFWFGLLTMATMILFCFGTAVGYIKTLGGILYRFKVDDGGTLTSNHSRSY
eukprot:GHVH01001158.1.p2 GENE.GHVH01001158.1~~GHVH01001158.1.p2  ORF type:complete len:246 (+),score=24.41 GHVH01001158.1:86-823(+)